MRTTCHRWQLTFILALMCTLVYAQGKKTAILGHVLDTDDSPVMYASICLISKGKVETGVLTDSIGFFTIKGPFDGEYNLRISSIGYVDNIKSINLSKGQTLDLGRIVLSPKENMLNGVVVSGHASTKSVTVEKTRINPTNMLATTTGSVLELLKNSPTVSIDNGGQVSIRGNGNVLFLIDGVPTTLDGLSSIPAANVQSLDIITSPDARYDSEGTGGIISIISKKQTSRGFSAMASANYGFNNFMNGNLAMDCNFGRWGLRFNYNAKREKDHIESVLYRNIRQTSDILNQDMDATKKTTGHDLGLNVSYKMTTKDVLTLSAKASFPRTNNFQTMHNHYVTNGVASDKIRQTDITFNREMVEGSLGYKHIFEADKRQISALASLSAINGHRPSYYYEQAVTTNNFEQVQYSKSGGHPRIASLQLDYMTPLGKGKLETGIKMTYRQNNIDHKMYEHGTTGSWQLSVPLSNDLRHREYIPAAYAMYSTKANDRLTWKAGVRMEYSRVTLSGEKENLDEASNCYFVSPNIMLNYHFNKSWQFLFGLSRRISRPTYPQLNPYINLIDNQTYETGNVHLKPEKVNKLDLGYNYSGTTLKISGNAYLNLSQDFINQISFLDNNILVMSYINSDMDLKLGIEHNAKWNVLRWLDIDLGSNIFFTNSRGCWQETPIRNHGFTTNSNIALSIRPIKGMSIQAQYFITTPQYFPQFTTKTIHYCNVGLRQQLLKNTLTLSALLTDVFNSRRWNISSDNPFYALTNTNKNRSRILWLGVSWNFHSYKPLGKQKKQEENRSVIKFGE